MKKKTLKVTKAEVAIIYALLIKIIGAKSLTFIFRPLNALIINKWSISALEDIKNTAWKIVNSGKTSYEIYDEAATAFEASDTQKSEM